MISFDKLFRESAFEQHNDEFVTENVRKFMNLFYATKFLTISR